MKAWLMLVSAVFLVGCVTQPGSLARSLGLEDSRHIAQEYCQTAYADPRINIVRGKLPIYAAPTIQMMSDPTFPTPEEQAGILAFSEQRENCNRQEAQAVGGLPAHVVASNQMISMITADLYSGKLSYGEFNRLIAQEISNRSMDNEQYRAQARQQQIAEDALAEQQRLARQQIRLQRDQNRDAALQSLMNRRSKQERLPLNCVTDYYGNQAQTRCH